MTLGYDIRILIADSFTLFREGLAGLLANEPHLFVIGEADNGIDMIKKYHDLKPDLIITDFHLQDLSGIKAIQRIRRIDRVTKFLILTGYKQEEYIYYSLKCGVPGLLHKDITKGEICYAIKKIYNGEIYYGANYNRPKLKEIIAKYDELRKTNFIYRKANFTVREKHIIYLVADALSSLEIAEKLKVSKRTIDTHRANLMQKLNLKTLPEFMKFAINYSRKYLKDIELNFNNDY